MLRCGRAAIEFTGKLCYNRHELIGCGSPQRGTGIGKEVAMSTNHTIKKQASGITRAITVGIAVILQVVTMALLVLYLRQLSVWVYYAIEMFSAILIFALVNDSESYKQFWVIIVLILPMFGFFLYFMWGRRRTNSKTNRHFREVERRMLDALKQDEDDELLASFQSIHPNKVQISRYLTREGFPMYNNTTVKYYGLGEQMKEAMLEDIRQAKSYIFMEYFIIKDGIFWQDVYELLKEKVKEGVEVWLLLDDFGCILINTRQFREEVRAAGIQLAEFAPIHKDINRLSFNYRNHQKITVIDGNIGYTGGINLADEYINEVERFGHWKDTAVRLEGEGVYSLTCFFLEMWQIAENTEELDYALYKPTVRIESESMVQPFADGPANNPKNTAESAYTHMINKARDYIYITTPYLVLDQKMADDLCRAAESGVDVRIITPHKYDKWYVYMVTVSNYGRLMEKGVRVYEYEPGFIHAKNVVVDDEIAVCGTVNIDYRSFYLHYEDAVLMSKTPAVMEIKQDFLDTLESCKEIQYAEWMHRPLRQRFVQSVLRLFSPLL